MSVLLLISRSKSEASAALPPDDQVPWKWGHIFPAFRCSLEEHPRRMKIPQPIAARQLFIRRINLKHHRCKHVTVFVSDRVEQTHSQRPVRFLKEANALQLLIKRVENQSSIWNGFETGRVERGASRALSGQPKPGLQSLCWVQDRVSA